MQLYRCDAAPPLLARTFQAARKPIDKGCIYLSSRCRLQPRWPRPNICSNLSVEPSGGDFSTACHRLTSSSRDSRIEISGLLVPRDGLEPLRAKQVTLGRVGCLSERVLGLLGVCDLRIASVAESLRQRIELGLQFADRVYGQG
jgi:hypothetical protein